MNNQTELVYNYYLETLDKEVIRNLIKKTELAEFLVMSFYKDMHLLFNLTESKINKTEQAIIGETEDLAYDLKDLAYDLICELEIDFYKIAYRLLAD
jgi:hypothetical protein